MYGPQGGATVGTNSINLSKSLENHNNNFNMERRYSETIQNYKKKEKQSRELLQNASKKLKTQEKKNAEETKISMELKKRYDVMQKKLEISQKEKSDIAKQTKNLYVIYTKQRKALELSIKKNKKYENDIDQSNRKQNEQIRHQQQLS